MRSPARRFPPSLQPAAERREKRDAERRGACKVRARARVPSKQAPLSLVGKAPGARARGPFHSPGSPLLLHEPLLPSPPPSRAAPHGLRAAEALPSAQTTLRSLGRAPTCRARPPAVSPAERRLLQALAHSANPVAAAAPAGTEASLQTPTPGLLPRKHFPLPLVLPSGQLYPLPGSGARTGGDSQKGGEADDSRSGVQLASGRCLRAERRDEGGPAVWRVRRGAGAPQAAILTEGRNEGLEMTVR